MSVRLCIAGAGGRMGQALLEAALADPECALASALDVAGSPVVAKDAGERFGRATGIAVETDIAAAVAKADVLVDFTRPAGTLAHAGACARAGVAAVVGTTGLGQRERERLAEFARSVPLVVAPNMSVGVTVLAGLVEEAARVLGESFDVEIVEMHHRHKVDAPSGTALLLGEAAARGLGRDMRADAVMGRSGVTGERKRGAVGFASLRGGDVVGDHCVVFAGPGERLELGHKAGSRLNFAQGALRAAKFVAEKRLAGEPGLFDMRDVLGLR